ncbi:hypothetical protein MPC4_710002 [Methylocella tundrae]|uniref:Uncharacterized protein n=1 Tax=Methylocella tundrae TaxID=227605 RepID=A0A8B6MBN0_METTU|nr:hypothetical protein MPC1_17350001 [Methylocella tundrae]VTZ52324.1 hypothetical protein MPC4_710002 [Methylocella tundrae]
MNKMRSDWAHLLVAWLGPPVNERTSNIWEPLEDRAQDGFEPNGEGAGLALSKRKYPP